MKLGWVESRCEITLFWCSNLFLSWSILKFHGRLTLHQNPLPEPHSRIANSLSSLICSCTWLPHVHLRMSVANKFPFLDGLLRSLVDWRLHLGIEDLTGSFQVSKHSRPNEILHVAHIKCTVYTFHCNDKRRRQIQMCTRMLKPRSFTRTVIGTNDNSKSTLDGIISTVNNPSTWSSTISLF